MKIIGTTIGLFILLLAGCNNSGGPTLLGIWQTEACAQMRDSQNNLINTWVKSLYEFSSQGTIRLGHKTFSDADCVTLANETAPTEGATPINYTDRGPTQLQEGIEGGGLLVEMDAGIQVISIDAFYTFSNNKLCFSEIFEFNAGSFGLSQIGSDAIDFNNCLIRP